MLRRLRQHRYVSEDKAGGEWKVRLKAAILLRNYGELCVDGEQDLTIYSDDQIAALDVQTLRKLVSHFEALGLDSRFYFEEIVPIFIEAAPVALLSEREAWHIGRREPVLNRVHSSVYPAGVKSEDRATGPAPEPISYLQIPCVVILAKKSAHDFSDQRFREGLSLTRSRLAELLQERALQKALPQADEVFSRELMPFSSVLRACGVTPLDLSAAVISMAWRRSMQLTTQHAVCS